jgi:broad specificity phosphatase PhoE
MRYFFIGLLMVVSCSCGNTFYVVRHAEKAKPIAGSRVMDANNPPLTEAGMERALALKELLSGKNIRHFYSTNTIRTISTVQPLKEQSLQNTILLYSSKADSMDMFIRQLKAIKKGNVLVVGHSNTVDDIANKLCGYTVIPGDLKDNEYDNLFIIKRKGEKYQFKMEKYGKPSE